MAKPTNGSDHLIESDVIAERLEDERAANGSYGCSKVDCLNVMHLNVQGLLGKELLLAVHLNQENVDVLCLCEHWLSREQLKCTNIDNYILISSFTRSVFSRGGVAIFVHKTVKVSSTPEVISTEKEFEVCMCKLLLGKLTTYVVAFYRSPGSDLNNFIVSFTDLFNKIYNVRSNYIICCDINVDLLVNNSERRLVLNFFREYNIVHHINVPTRITYHSRTCIDNIFSNLHPVSKLVKNTFVSDHCYVVCQFQSDFDRTGISCYKRIINIANINLFIGCLLQVAR